MSDKFAWARGDVETLTGQEYARTVSFWDWQKFNKLRPEIQVCVRATKKDKTPIAFDASYEVNAREGYKWVDFTFWTGGSVYCFSVNQFEIAACLNAPQRYEPTLSKWLAEVFYGVTLKLA